MKKTLLILIVITLILTLVACNGDNGNGGSSVEKSTSTTTVITTTTGPWIASEGLEFSLNIDCASYSVVGLGNCIDANVVIPKTYEGLPVTNASFIIPIFYLVATMFSVGTFWYTAIMIFGYLAVSVAFVLKFKLPKLGVKDIFKVIFIITRF